MMSAFTDFSLTRFDVKPRVKENIGMRGGKSTELVPSHGGQKNVLTLS